MARVTYCATHELFVLDCHMYTLKTGTPMEDGDPISMFLWGVSHAEIQFIVN